MVSTTVRRLETRKETGREREETQKQVKILVLFFDEITRNK